ncbi:TIGR02391 family protein [Streptomyces massasporeus]
MNDQGQVARGPAAATLSEAAQHASSLQAGLRRRSTHPEVLRYCTLDILAKNPFHASLEAVKSVADRLRTLTGQGLDGARLVDTVLMSGQGTARVAINANATGPELDEQKGLANLAKGLFSMYRNPAAHEPRLHRTVTDENCWNFSPHCQWCIGDSTARTSPPDAVISATRTGVAPAAALPNRRSRLRHAGDAGSGSGGSAASGLDVLLAAGPPGARRSAVQKASGGAARFPSWTPCGKDDGS